MAEIPKSIDNPTAKETDVLAVNTKFLAKSAKFLMANSKDRQEMDREVGTDLVEEKGDQFAADLEGTLALQKGKTKLSVVNLLVKILPKEALQRGEKGELLVPKEALEDKELAKNLETVVDYKLADVERAKARENLNVKMQAYKVNSAQLDATVREFTNIKLKADLTVAFLTDYKNLSPAEFAKRVEWNKRLFDNQEKMRRGELNPLEYAVAVDEVYEEGVKEFGDEECKKHWERYKKGAVYMSAAKAQETLLGQLTETNNVGVSDVANAIDEAGSALASTGVKIDYSFIDGASVAADGFSLPLTIGKSEAGYAFYLKDSTANDGKVGPIRAADLANEFDKRHVDSFFTAKVTKKLNDNADVAKLPDKMMAGLVYRLLGDGAKRGFVLGKRQRAVLENLAKSLVVEDGNYLTMYKRMVALSEFVKKENNVNYLVKNLSRGTVRNVSEYMSEGDAGENLLA